MYDNDNVVGVENLLSITFRVLQVFRIDGYPEGGKSVTYTTFARHPSLKLFSGDPGLRNPP